MAPTPSVEVLVERYQLETHPEGGWYRRFWQHDGERAGRPLASAIHYLLPAGVSSRWHRVDAAELWFHHQGDPLVLSTSADGEIVDQHELGPGDAPARLSWAVPPGSWQSAATTGAYTLVSCTVVPAFEWEGFELAPEGWTPGTSASPGD
jgi:predicted cupin superfamily sugar epimerase